MARRREAPIFQQAESNITVMERNVVYALATLEGVTPDDVLDWLYPPVVLKPLRDAFLYAAVGSGLSSVDELPAPYTEAQFMINFKELKCVIPGSGYAAYQPDAPKAEACQTYLETVCRTRSQYDKLREIVKFFHDNHVTPGAARHYWPTMQSLLPKDHAFFQLKGDRFKEVYFTQEITEYLREAPEIIAKGLLCPAWKYINDGGPVRLQVNNGTYFYLFGR